MKTTLLRSTLILAVLALVLTGCGRIGAAPTPVLGVGSTPGKALATIWLSPTPQPGSQATSPPTLTPAPTLPLPTLAAAQPTLPIGTAGPLQEPVSTATPEGTLPGGTPAPPAGECASAPPDTFGQVWGGNPAARERLGCPVGLPTARTAAFQEFEHGFMFWIQAENSIYVLSNTAIEQAQETDTWWRLDDTFAEGDPITDDTLAAPDGLLQPERGFGKVWRSNGFVREAVGWATGEEEGYEAEWLDFERGWMMTSPGGESVLVLIPSDESPNNSGVHLGPQFVP
jgi:hypothetical protein